MTENVCDFSSFIIQHKFMGVTNLPRKVKIKK